MFGATPNSNMFRHRISRRPIPTVSVPYQYIPPLQESPNTIDPPLQPPSPNRFAANNPIITPDPVTDNSSIDSSPSLSIMSTLSQISQTPNLISSDLQDQQRNDANQFQILSESSSAPRLPIEKDDDVIKIFSMIEETTQKVKVEIVEDPDNLSNTEDPLPIEIREECGICFDNFCVGEEKCKLPCNHVFHKECVMKWLIENRKNQCAICRYKVTDPPIEKKLLVDKSDSSLDKKSLNF